MVTDEHRAARTRRPGPDQLRQPARCRGRRIPSDDAASRIRRSRGLSHPEHRHLERVYGVRAVQFVNEFERSLTGNKTTVLCRSVTACSAVIRWGINRDPDARFQQQSNLGRQRRISQRVEHMQSRRISSEELRLFYKRRSSSRLEHRMLTSSYKFRHEPCRNLPIA
jgi:hypothetical protein